MIFVDFSPSVTRLRRVDEPIEYVGPVTHHSRCRIDRNPTVSSTVEFRPEVHQWRENFTFPIQPVPLRSSFCLGDRGQLPFIVFFCRVLQKHTKIHIKYSHMGMPQREGTVDCPPKQVQFSGPGGPGTNFRSKFYSRVLCLVCWGCGLRLRVFTVERDPHAS